MFAAFFTEVDDNVFRNESHVQLFYKSETMEFIWQDPKNLMQNEMKKQIGKIWILRSKKSFKTIL